MTAQTLRDSGRQANDVDVVFVDLDSCAEVLEKAELAIPRLSAADLARAESMRNDSKRRRAWCATRTATRIAIERVAGSNFSNVDFVIEKGGRPRLPGGPHFSIAHSGSAALIAVAPHHEVGVDLEKIRHINMPYERRTRIVNTAERLCRHSSEDIDPDISTLKAWVCLEALAKARGSGIGTLLTNEGVIGGSVAGAETSPTHYLEVRSVHVPQGYIAAIAAATLLKVVTVTMFPSDDVALAAFLASTKA